MLRNSLSERPIRELRDLPGRVTAPSSGTKSSGLCPLHHDAGPQAVEQGLRRLLARNPLRTDLQKHYEEIVDTYNHEKEMIIQQTRGLVDGNPRGPAGGPRVSETPLYFL